MPYRRRLGILPSQICGGDAVAISLSDLITVKGNAKLNILMRNI